MHLYLTTGKRDHLIIVQPGKEFPTSDFCGHDGTPLTFSVQFVDGKASNVRHDLANYLLDKGLVQRSPIMTDLAMAKRLEVQDERVRTHRILTST
ncbi:hypothetical protein [Paraburkholderia nemoris]|jgi:hypothetical protein|uniref:hypothetical protein n=1 Tax=Paraburkholderia nemoris TaxID=2793076 RepID=UPI001B1D7F47|nr:hypothetical protein [Paraburkholderia nemoris]CAE6838422.1 hypothetical protein R75777_06948 [Paraburkholderia nemoris]